ncbi:ABC transporter permease [Geobacter sp. SVR]|uniref:MlaE family ABC transporter permease n=1 Tax=Geobacter sp. SVR TaxID=2495594 RepID=UPI00143F00CF|nr:ABC transporter permease [Geobacter sp. SVR]BCS52903.1 ABC transporter permease [Geobacter sp. SVR]GCF87525.1 ABC transporter permease [Geobacter sp. SVR]
MKPSELTIERSPEGAVLLTLAGDWRLGNTLPAPDGVLAAPTPGERMRRLAFDTGSLAGWDSGLLIFLARLFEIGRRDGLDIDQSGLPAGVRRLLDLASPANQRTGVTRGGERPPFLARVGGMTLDWIEGGRELLEFIGEATRAFFRMLRGKASFRRLDLLVTIQETGAQALPIVTLISLLVGMILAFVAAIQLKLFGAQIYVADVVGIGIVRVMGAIMTGIIMSGRTGAAFAAQLGTMQVNEEIDALETLGFSPVEFLVLPRMLALMLMMPLLCVYADLMGIMGGMTVGVGMLGIGVVEYINESKNALNLSHFLVGLFHSFVFGILVAVFGCLRGIQCERSASAVGYAATSAVVTSIVGIVVATLIITLSCQVLGI